MPIWSVKSRGELTVSEANNYTDVSRMSAFDMVFEYPNMSARKLAAESHYHKSLIELKIRKYIPHAHIVNVVWKRGSARVLVAD